MKKWLIIAPLLIFLNYPLMAANNKNNQQNASAMNCDSKKIEACMSGCVKKIRPSANSTNAISKINGCVDACSSQGCQVAKQAN